MGPEVVVVVSPGCQFLAGMSQRCEDRFVQALVAQAGVKAFDKTILIGLTRRDVVPLHITFLRPAKNRHAGEFGAVMSDERMGPSHPLEHRCIKLSAHPRAGDRRIGDQAQALPAVIIDYGEDAEPPSSSEGIGHDVQAPALVRSLR